MRYVDRSGVAAPASIASVNGAGAKELVKARDYYDKAWTKAYGFKAYKSDDIKQALRALFHGKCAYCEARYDGTQPVDIEHYRPKGGVQDNDSHPGYWWLAMVWSNLLPSCIDCNRRRGHATARVGMTLAELEAELRNLNVVEQLGKENAFPTADGIWAEAENDPDPIEQPLLIDPTRTDPDNHLRWWTGEVPVVVPRQGAQGECPRAVASIHLYALNRLGLVQSRAEVLRGLEAQAKMIRVLARMAMGASPEDREALLDEVEQGVLTLRGFCGPKDPFSAMASAFVASFVAEIAALRTPAA